MSPAEWLEMFQTVGVPSVVAGAAFWFIKYMYDAANTRDADADDKIFQLAERSIEAINNMSSAMEQHTKSIDQLLNEIRSKK